MPTSLAAAMDCASIGLRYFNVFGSRQDPEGAYAAVIPRWVAAMLSGKPIVIHGDGETTRDFCHVSNVVQANLLAATVADSAAIGQVYNVAVGGRMSLNGLFGALRELLVERHHGLAIPDPIHEDFRPGDVRHSQADVTKAQAPARLRADAGRPFRIAPGPAVVRGSAVLVSR